MKTYLRFKYVLVLTMLLMAWMPSARVMASNAFVALPSHEALYDDELEAVKNNLRDMILELRVLSQRIAEELEQKATEEEAPEFYERLNDGLAMLEVLNAWIDHISDMDDFYACQDRILELRVLFINLREDIAAFQPTLIPDEAIDLGLPSGTKWAPWNVGASKPEDYGGYYAWGETEEKEVYMSYTYIPQDIGTDITGTEYDVAHAKWGRSWTMPTLEQVEELVNNCTSEWTTVNGINGRRFTGPNGNSIFLPADGLYSDGGKYDEGTSGNYWSSNSAVGYSQRSYSFSFGSDGNSIYATATSCGLTVRPVISVSTGIAIDATNFPDENFRNWVLAQDYGQDGVLTAEEIAGVLKIDVFNKNIADLKGIEYFTALTQLSCGYNQLTSLDVSKNTALTGLYCGINQLTSLDVSKNTALTELECGINQLTSLDVSKNTALTELYCNFNQLTALDVSKNTALTDLYCNFNQLTSLDVSKNTALTEFECGNNQLTALDVSKNTALVYLGCSGNQINETEMGKLVESLSVVSNGQFLVKDLANDNDLNVITTSQVAAAKAKGWKVYQNNGTDWVEMEGVVDNEDNVFWENDGTHGESNWESTYRFAYEGHQDSGMCIAEFPQDVWDKIKTQRFYMDVVATYPQIRVTNGWWSATWTDDDIYPGNELLTDNGDGTFTVTLNLFDDPDFVRDLDERDLLFTGGGYTPVKLYFDKTEEIAGGETSGSCGDNVFWTYDESDHTLTISGTGDMTDFPTGSIPWRSQSSSLKTVVIEDGVTSIGDYAFYGNSSMTSITIPSSVTRIGRFAFVNCNNLPSVSIPSGVTNLGRGVFNNCSSLTSVIIPNSVTSIGDVAFQYCYNITSVIIGNSVTNIGEKAFRGCGSLKSVTIPNSVTHMGKSAFEGCGLTSVTISNSVVSLADKVFCGCPLTSVSIPNSVTSIGKAAFAYCGNLTSVTIPNSVTSIGNEAFRNCHSLTSVTIPNTVTSIGIVAFAYCSSLTEVRSMISEPFAIDESTFATWNQGTESYDAPTATLYVRAGTKALYESTEGWNMFENIVEMEDLEPVDNGEQNFGEGGDITEETVLNGVVVDNMFYNIGTDAGGYNSEEGCIVITQETSDEQMELLQGMGISDEELQQNFTGIIFKVPAGKGTVTVTAETTGSMTLKVKVGNGQAVEMELSGKLKMTFPYDVSEESLVYIYAGTTGESGARRSAEESSLKIYGIEWTSTSMPGDADGDGTIDVNDITCVAAHILGRNPANFNAAAADADGDGTIDVNDITVIAGMILNAGK